MNKEIEKVKRKLTEALFEQEKRKVRYDAHVIIIEAQRRQLSDLVEQNQKFMNELIDSGETVKQLQEQLKTLEDEANKETEQTT